MVPVGTLMQRLPPRDYVDGHSLVLAVGDRLDLDATRRRLERAGYSCVSQVIGHGEYAVRGSLLDVFPMGSQVPLRIDLFDVEIESIRTFDPDTQRSKDKIERIRLLPAREFPLDEEAIAGFRQRYRASIEGDPQASLIYREVSDGQHPGRTGILSAALLRPDRDPLRLSARGRARLRASRRCRETATRLLRRCRTALRTAPTRHRAPPAAPGAALSAARRAGGGAEPALRRAAISRPRSPAAARATRTSATSRPPPCPRWRSRRAPPSPPRRSRTSSPRPRAGCSSSPKAPGDASCWPST